MENALAGFLQSRRARIQPEDLGLRPYGRRRVPGLRREEVAQLAGVSVDYYIRLEQGRSNHVSDAVLDGVARVLRLDPTERAHLRNLARQQHERPARTRGPGGPPAGVRPGVQLLLDNLADRPALVFGSRMEVLAWNDLGGALHDVTDEPGSRDMPRRVFLDLPHSSARYPDWTAVAAEIVSYLRLQAGQYPDDPQLAAVISDLRANSGDFRRLWADHQVAAKTYGRKRISHPAAGELSLTYETLALPSDPRQTMIVYTAPPGSVSAERLVMLAAWARHGRLARRRDHGHFH